MPGKRKAIKRKRTGGLPPEVRFVVYSELAGSRDSKSKISRLTGVSCPAITRIVRETGARTKKEEAAIAKEAIKAEAQRRGAPKEIVALVDSVLKERGRKLLPTNAQIAERLSAQGHNVSPHVVSKRYNELFKGHSRKGVVRGKLSRLPIKVRTRALDLLRKSLLNFEEIRKTVGIGYQTVFELNAKQGCRTKERNQAIRIISSIYSVEERNSLIRLLKKRKHEFRDRRALYLQISREVNGRFTHIKFIDEFLDVSGKKVAEENRKQGIQGIHTAEEKRRLLIDNIGALRDVTKSYAKNYLKSFPELDLRDIHQTAYGLCFKALDDFDPRRGKITTFIYAAVKGGLRSEIRREITRIRREKSVEVPKTGRSVSKRIAAQETLKTDASLGLNRIISALETAGVSKRDQLIIRLIAEGKSIKEVSEHAGVRLSQQGTRNTARSALKKAGITAEDLK